MSQSFYIAALPRSRTAWLSTLLCGRRSFCFHEALGRWGAIPSRAEAFVGTVETMVDLIPRGAERTLIVLQRPEDSIRRTLAAFDTPSGFTESEWCGTVSELAFASYETMRGLDGMRVELDDLDRRLIEVWRYLLPGVPLDMVRINEAQRMRVQIASRDLQAIYRAGLTVRS